MSRTPLEDLTVSRKTPGDGKLEITRPVAEKLERVGTRLEIKTPAGNGAAELTSMPCTCRGKDNPHEHWFLASPLLCSLIPGTEIALSLDGQTVVVTETNRTTA
jgi:hypothetical protein